MPTPDSAAPPRKLSVVVAACDEEETIDELTERLIRSLDGMAGWSWELIYVVEGVDGTRQAAEEWAARRAGIRCLHQRRRSGLGASFRRGFAAVAPDADLVVTLDADLNHQPEEIPGLVAAAVEARSDILIGSRFVSGGRSEGTPAWKLLLSRTLGAVMGRRFSLPILDKTSGFRVYRREALSRLAYRADNFAFLPEMLVLARALGMRVEEAPIHFIYRRAGRSKMGLWSTSLSYLHLLSRRIAVAPGGEARRELKLALGCLGVVALFVGSLEMAHPYYFLQDDNRDMTLPLYVLQARTLAGGGVAQFNFHQSLGTPLLATGQPATLSPAPYLAVATSRVVWGHPFAAVELLALIYFPIGALGMIRLGRALGLSRRGSLFAALSWPLLPATVYYSVSWCVVMPLVGLLPWILAGALHLARGSAGLAAALGLAAAQTLLFLSGYPQWVVDGLILQAGLLLAYLPVAPRPRRAFGWWTLGGVLSLLWSLPLLAPMAYQVAHSWARSMPLPYATFAGEAVRASAWLNGVLWPFARWLPASSAHYYSEYQAPVAFSHLGYPAILLAALAIGAWRRGTPESRRATAVVAAAAALMLAWTLGWLSPVLYHVPVVNRFRWPVRQIFCFEIAAVLLAGLGIDRLGGRRARWLTAAAIVLQVVNLWAANLLHPYRGFVVHSDPLPLTEPWRERLADGRIVSLGHYALGGRSDTIRSVGFNYASLWGLFHFGGYDTLTSKESYAATRAFSHSSSYADIPEHLDVAFLRSWGVRWYVASPGGVRAYADWLRANGVVPVHCEEDRCLFEDRAAPPLAAWAESGTGEGLDLELRGAQLDVHATRDRGGDVVLLFLDHPFLRAKLDGRPAELRRTPGRQLLVSVPAGSHTISLVYRDPLFALGLWGAAGGAVLALVAAAFEARARRRPAPPPIQTAVG